MLPVTAGSAGAEGRPRKQQFQIWKKALFHFTLCFAMGFFYGFAPASTAPHADSGTPLPPPVGVVHLPSTTIAAAAADADADTNAPAAASAASRELMESEQPEQIPLDPDDSPVADPPRLIIVVTAARRGAAERAALLRLAQTLRLVRPPLIWLVASAGGEATIAAVLRRTGVMFRQLTTRENFVDAETRTHHLHNLALVHVESHRLSGIVHFAATEDIHDLQFFEEIRQIEVFGTWPVATMTTGSNKVVVEGPVCDTTTILGWYTRESTTHGLNYKQIDFNHQGAAAAQGQSIKVSDFAFNSTILWDPERWGRSASLPDTSQDSVRFVEDVILEDMSKLKGFPSGCSQIMLWHVKRLAPASDTTTRR